MAALKCCCRPLAIIIRNGMVTGLDARENEPTCAQFSGPTVCAGMIRCDVRITGVPTLGIDWKATVGRGGDRKRNR
jgi:hypothetical protein